MAAPQNKPKDPERTFFDAVSEKAQQLREKMYANSLAGQMEKARKDAEERRRRGGK